MFALFFKSNYVNTRLDNRSQNSVISMVPGFGIGDIDINNDTLLANLKAIKLTFSPDPDNIPSSVLKFCYEPLGIPLLHLFKLSLNSSTFPSVWKSSHIIPLHKKRI